jgi:YhcH/YjgK/YiaL family protein
MIFDHIDNAERYYALHPVFPAAFEFLRRPDLASLPPGRNAIDGERMFCMVVRGPGRGKDGAQLEMHRQYLDIQFTVAGTDALGWSPTRSCQATGSGFDEAKDVEFFTARPETWVSIPPRTFAILYPEDAHAPLGGTGDLHKVVMKVRLK